MKRLFSIILVLCMALACFTSCNNGTDPVSTSGTGNQSGERTLEIVDGVLKECKGQSDENGVYVVPANVTEIGEGAFSGDNNLKKVIMHDNVTVISEGAFFSCINLKEVVFGKGLERIDGGAFQYCESLTDVIIPEGVKSIGSMAFYQCASLSSIILPSTLELIDTFAFALCVDLVSIDIPDSVKTIGQCAFQSCWSLVNIKLPKDLEIINYQTFAGCKLLQTIDMSECLNLKTIGLYAFWDCVSLKNVKLPSSLEVIEEYAFYQCQRLSKLDIPASLKTAKQYAFDGTPWYAELSDDYVIVGDGVLIKCNKTAAYLDLSGLGIKTLGGGVFRDSLGFYGGTDDYGSSTSYGYSQAQYLTGIIIPEGVERIENDAFSGTYLYNVSIPSTVNYIGDRAFYNSIMWSLDQFSGEAIFPKIDLSICKDLTYIGDYAFSFCYGLKEIILPKQYVQIGAYAYFKTQALCDFFVDCYENDDKDSFLIINETLIAGYVGKNTTSIEIPNGIKSIAGTAFVGWDSKEVVRDEDAIKFEEVSDYDSLFNREKYYFGYRVKNVTIPNSVEYIDAQAFYCMRVLESINVPSSVKVIGNSAFMNCYGMKTITLNEGLKEVVSGAFKYCYEIDEMVFPSTVEKVGNDIFDYCTSLKTVVFDKNTVDIGDDLFSDECTSLSLIFFAPSLKARTYGIIGSLYNSAERSALNVRYYIPD